MRTVFTIVGLLLISGLSGQMKGLRIVDAATNAPLGFVQVSFSKGKVHGYADSSGNFEIDLSRLQDGDSIVCSHIGYKKTALAIKDLFTLKTIRLERSARELDSVAVKYCSPPIIARGEWPRKPRRHTSVSPGLKLIFVGVYENKAGVSGYLHRIGFHVAGYSNYLDLPVRLRWYEWDEASNLVKKELTDTSIVLIPTKKGWNYFAIPERAIPVSGAGIALGIEFIYSAGMIKDYVNAIDKGADTDWRKRRLFWHIGIERPRDGNMFEKPTREFVYQKAVLRVEIKGCR